MFGPFVSY